MKEVAGWSRPSQEVVANTESWFAPRISCKMDFSSLGKFWQPRICFYQKWV